MNRAKEFEPFGYQTLVIWGKELKNLDKIKERIRKEFYHEIY
jgi:hypothetical protein